MVFIYDNIQCHERQELFSEISNGYATVMAIDATGKASQVELTVFRYDPDVHKAGDVDGLIDLKDVVLLRRFLAGGWDVTLV